MIPLTVRQMALVAKFSRRFIRCCTLYTHFQTPLEEPLMNVCLRSKAKEMAEGSERDNNMM